MTACDSTTDLLLIERIATRDAAAIAALYDRHCRLLYSLVFRILHDPSEAEEVLQEVFFIAWTRVETYDRDLGSPVAWLVRIARNRAIDRLRSLRARMRALESAPAAGTIEDADTPETEVLRSEQRSAVGRALNALPLDQRVLIENAYFMGLSQSELATRFELPLGTVKTRIRAGLKLLREALVQGPATVGGDEAAH